MLRRGLEVLLVLGCVGLLAGLRLQPMRWDPAHVTLDGLQLGMTLSQVRDLLGAAREGSDHRYYFDFGERRTEVVFVGGRAARIRGSTLWVDGVLLFQGGLPTEAARQIGPVTGRHRFEATGRAVDCWTHPLLLLETCSFGERAEFRQIWIADPRLPNTHGDGKFHPGDDLGGRTYLRNIHATENGKRSPGRIARERPFCIAGAG